MNTLTSSFFLTQGLLPNQCVWMKIVWLVSLSVIVCQYDDAGLSVIPKTILLAQTKITTNSYAFTTVCHFRSFLCAVGEPVRHKGWWCCCPKATVMLKRGAQALQTLSDLWLAPVLEFTSYSSYFSKCQLRLNESNCSLTVHKNLNTQALCY